MMMKSLGMVLVGAAGVQIIIFVHCQIVAQC
jgi:hypothetical protein